MANIARNTALRALYDIHKNGAYSNLAIKEALQTSTLHAADRRLVTELVHGVVRYQLHLDHIIAQFSKVKHISYWVRDILRMGLYQIYYLDRIPDSAAVNESVQLARKYGGARSAGFVNGLLRSAIRGKESITYPKDQLQALCIKESFPFWIGQRWCTENGLDYAKELMAASNRKAPLTLRCNLTKTSPEALISWFQNSGIAAKQFEIPAAPHVPYAITVSGISAVETLPAFLDGWFYIQDPGAMLVSEILDPQPGETILDVCAAPGGKTTHIAEKMQNTGTVHAFDLYAHKCELIAKNAKRLGLTIIQPHVADITKGMQAYHGQADRVLADVPCSGLGVIRRKPDIKYARKPEDMQIFARQSQLILHQAAQCVKPGGILVFSTCTVECTENEAVADAFLQKHPEFRRIPIEGVTCPNDGYIRLLPHTDETDGFFIAKLQKIGG